MDRTTTIGKPPVRRVENKRPASTTTTSTSSSRKTPMSTAKARPSPTSTTKTTTKRTTTAASAGRPASRDTITEEPELQPAADIASLTKTHSDTDEQQRKSPSALDIVETRIQAVEKALAESKSRASMNEEELQKTIEEKDQDREQLARVVEDLKQEIDRCQTKLDADVAKRAQEKREAIEATEQLRKELEEERETHKKVIDELRAENDRYKAEREADTEERAQEKQQAIEVAERLEMQLEDQREAHKKMMDQLRAENRYLKEEREADTAKHVQEMKEATQDTERLKQELDNEREAHIKAIENLKEDFAVIEKAHDEGAGAVESLKTKISELETERNEQISRIGGLEKAIEQEKSDYTDSRLQFKEERKLKAEELEHMQNQIQIWQEKSMYNFRCKAVIEANLQLKIQELEEVVEEARNEVMDARTEAEEARTQTGIARTEAAEASVESDRIIKNGQDEIQEARRDARWQIYLAENSQQEAENYAEQLRGEMMDMAMDYDELKEARGALEEELSGCKKTMEQDKVYINDLRDEKWAAERAKEEAEKKTAELTTEFETTKEKMEDLTMDYDELKEAHGALEEELNGCKKTMTQDKVYINDLREEKWAAERAKEEAEKRLAGLITDYATAKVKLEDLTMDCDELKESRVALEEELSGCKTAMEHDKDERWAAERAKDEAEKRLAELERRFSETPSAHESDHMSISPTPAYPRGGKRAGAERSSPQSIVKLSTAATDHYAAPRVRPPTTPLGEARQDSGLTLEGTIASLQVQAAQLLEAQDDIQAENERFKRRMASARKPRSRH
ncbi:uncharacterized protein LTR77_007738 [Saxophila tyrrhenica]|uniref:Uncharacterized protein n=1 Tax=Saxophila tyrrhenica TaxID=1690608 RepID=A0AAV9P2Y2_9PEZI|nr:hypothetical protein LTR77_007738 [Saxophila tyrrhenica]